MAIEFYLIVKNRHSVTIHNLIMLTRTAPNRSIEEDVLLKNELIKQTVCAERL